MDHAIPIRYQKQKSLACIFFSLVARTAPSPSILVSHTSTRIFSDLAEASLRTVLKMKRPHEIGASPLITDQ